MAQQVRSPAAKPAGLNSIPKTHMAEGEPCPARCPLTCTGMLWHTHNTNKCGQKSGVVLCVFFNLKLFFIQCILTMPPPIPTHLLTLPTPSSISLSLSLKIKNSQPNSPKKPLKIETKKLIRQQQPPNNHQNSKQSEHRKTMAFVLCLGPANISSGMSLTYLMTLHWKKGIFSFP